MFNTLTPPNEQPDHIRKRVTDEYGPESLFVARSNPKTDNTFCERALRPTTRSSIQPVATDQYAASHQQPVSTRPVSIPSLKPVPIIILILIASLAFVPVGHAQTGSPEISEMQINAADFENWKHNFRSTALEAGVNAAIYDREMASVLPLERIRALNNNQAEFSKAIWAYLDGAVSETRIKNGRKNFEMHKSVLSLMEGLYGVDSEIMTAIWGLESSYGSFTGNHDILSALATLAYEGRRTRYGSTQLIAALKIIQHGFATRHQLKGSWAGAMGQTQFIPTTYLDYAIDHDGDGARDLWGNHYDIFASTAHYLARSGYVTDAPWGHEISLPPAFSYTLTGRQHRRPVVEWASLGIRLADPRFAENGGLGRYPDPNMMGYIILPAGAAGPAFLVFDNFDAILRYNNATSYAIAIGMLSDYITGRAVPLNQPWPRGDRPLSREERYRLQKSLNDRGYNAGLVDGIIGVRTKNALRAWQADNGLPEDGYPSAQILEKILSDYPFAETQ